VDYQDYLRRFQSESGVPVVEMEDDGPPVECSYEAWYGVPSLPRINLASPAARRYFLDVAGRWVRDFGIDGWRMDVARYVDFDFWREFRRVVKAVRPDSYLLAEVFGTAAPWLQGDTFDATMHYTFRALAVDFFATRDIDGEMLADGITRMHASYSPEVTLSCHNLLGSHDTARYLSVASGHDDRLHLATIFQLTMPGAPGLYYGDEVGMTGGDEPESRAAFPWHDEGSWDREQLRIVRELAALRRSHPALRTGSYRERWHSRDAIAFTRTLGKAEVLVVINRGDDPARASLPPVLRSASPLWGRGTPESVPAGSALIALA
jgi:neopullulanase